MIAVTGRIENSDLGSVSRAVQKVLDAPGMITPGVHYELGGLKRQQDDATAGIATVMAVGILLVFLLLLFLYESFRVPVAMLLTTMLAVAAVMLGLWVTGTELNISSEMGLVMIIGNVTEVAIFYYSEFTGLPEGDPTIDRLITAGTGRARAISMTTIAAILALAPLALGLGQGSAMLRPMAIAIITGLAVQLPLVLVAMPALLMMMGIRKPRRRGTA